MKKNHAVHSKISSATKHFGERKSWPNTQHLLLTITASLLMCTSAQARVTKIVIDETLAMAPATNAPAALSTGAQTFVNGSSIPYEIIAGRAFGELDPALPQNALIQDIELAKDADGKVRSSPRLCCTNRLTTSKQAACSGTTYQTVVACFRLRHKSKPLVIFC